MGLWDKLRSKPAGDADSGDTLARLLADYPANCPKHVGDITTLSDADRDENFDYFLSTRDERLAIVGDFLRAHGADPAPMLAPDADGSAAACAIDTWLAATLPRRPQTIMGDETPNPPEREFRASDRAGPDIYFSLIADLALLEGEAIRRRDDRFAWAVNRLKGFHDMPSYHQICLIKPGSKDWDPTVLELDEHILAICHAKMAPGGDTTGHHFGELLDGALNRAFDP